jgi:16S rRNA (uracil1498-N3)-methyltransferase
MSHRYFVEEIGGRTARLTGQDAKHLAGVLRAKPGQAVVLCTGAGTDYDAVITAVGKDAVEFSLGAPRKSAAEPALWAEVFIGMAKGERMDYAVQKAVELGASAIWPFYSAHSVVKPKNDDAKTQRFSRIARAAAQQSGRGILPAVHPPLDFAGVLQQAAQCRHGLFFYEEGGAALRTVLLGGETSLALITGPEGGFSPGEAALARQAGFATVGLGPRILRCETAPAAVLAAVMALTGNLE